MAESNQISRKRMRFSSSATEILTRSRSQNHKDCSVRFAPAASHSGNGIRVHHSSSLCGKIDSKVVRAYSRVTIKDLRIRRVFSPSSISGDWKFKTKGENQSKKQDEEFPCGSHISYSETAAKEGIRANAEAEEILQTTPPDSEIFSSGLILNENEAEKINGLALKKSGTNLCSKSILHPCSRAKIFKNPGSFSYKRLLPYLMQAADDGTSSGRCSKPDTPFDQNPPKVNLLSKKETEGTVDDSKEEVSELMTAKCQLPETTKPVLQSVDRGLNIQSAVSFCGNTSPLKKAVASSPNKKSVCSRRKLFKTPGSVNYRRLLPYLRDIQEDNHLVFLGVPETVNHEDRRKSTEENAPLRILVSENEGTPETMTSNVVKESDTCSHGNEGTLPCEHVSESPERSDLEKEQETQVKHVIPDTEENLRTPHIVLATEAPLSPPFVDSRCSSEVASSALNNTFTEQLPVDGSSLTTELLDPSVVLETPSSISPSKGILKRNIRGCRGICSCLNCSSFRLNAERAFEFSRNQLLDTEVLVLDLVGEVSHLRAMLEKYDSADQAGEAAKKASEAAELAKSRLHQMNADLQVHCRIPNEQRARVKFAHYVHEKTILEASET